MGAEGQVAPVLAEVWPTWRTLVRQFSLVRFVLEFLVSPGSWRAFGVDLLSGLRANRSTSQAASHLRALSLKQVAAIVQLAELNVRRQEQMFRLLVVIYVSVPFSLAALLFQAAPDDARQLFANSANVITRMIALAVVAVVFYLACAWRARQLLTAVTLASIELQSGEVQAGAEPPAG